MLHRKREIKDKTLTTQAILDSIRPNTEPEDLDLADDLEFPYKAFLVSFVLTLIFYYPVARGYCWLVLALAYYFGVDGAAWPGPYTPYPEQF